MTFRKGIYIVPTNRWYIERTVWLIAGLVLIVLMVLIYIEPVRQAVGITAPSNILDIANIIFSFATAILCFMLARKYQRGEVLFTVWLLLGTGLLLWAVGEVLYAWIEIQTPVGEETPYPTIADIPWVLGYIPLTAGLILRFRSLQTEPERRWVIALIIGFLVVLVLSAIFVFAPVLSQYFILHSFTIVNASCGSVPS
jgi:hypothetical protein